MTKCGLYLEGEEKIEIGARAQANYELKFAPKQVGRFRGSLIFFNEDVGEFWYDLKLSSDDPQPVQADLIEAEVGRLVSFSTSFFWWFQIIIFI